MEKSPSEAIPFVTLHHADGESSVFRSRSNSVSDTSSLASLLDDGLTDIETTPRSRDLQLGDTALDPKGWPNRKKMFVAVAIAFYTSVFYSGSSIFMVSVPGVMIQYRVSQETALMGLSLYVLSYGLGPLLWAPLSEVRWIGRSPIYILTILAFVAISFLTATTALRTLWGFLGLRFLQGFFGSPCLANGGASMHDMFDDRQLPYALSIWIAFAYAGPALGPALTAYPTQRHGWQFPMWFIAYCSVPACLLLLFLPETYLPKILYRKGSYAKLADHDEHARETQPAHLLQDDVWATLKDSLIKPVEISLLDPSVSFVNFYTSFCYATYYAFFDALPITYMTKYGFTLSEVAVACTCIMLGCMGGLASYFAYIYYVANRKVQNTHEDRLKPALIAVFLIPVGITIFAFASNGRTHWAVGMFGIAIYSGAVFIILQCLCMYMLKSYPAYAASLFAANDAFRSVLAAAAVHAGVPYYQSLGVVKGCSILAVISTLGIVGMFVLYWKGPALRARSKFAAR